MKKIIISLFILCLLTSCSVSGNNKTETEQDKINVTCTIFPQYDIARKIGGDRINLTLLLKMGTDSHNYEQTPVDIITAGNSDLFITVGGAADIWVNKVFPTLTNKNDIKVIELLKCVQVLEEEVIEGMQDEETEESEEEHETSFEYDEHVWTNPNNVIKIAGYIYNAFVELDKENEEFYKENYNLLIGDLKRLDSDIRQVVSSAERKTLVFGDKFAFRYFTEEYGLDYFAAFPGCSTDTDASAQTIAFLIDKVRDEKIPVVYYLENGTEKIADAICREIGTEPLLLNSCHTVSADNLKFSYIDLMYMNLENLKKGLN